MHEAFAAMLAEDGKKNSLGRANEVIELVLNEPSRLEELYQTIVSNDDAWVRMRAVDAFEKICRSHSDWIQPYVDRLQKDLSDRTQPSIQWHIAEIYMQVKLNTNQKKQALAWLEQRLESTDVDWIVAVNSMKTLAYFAAKGDITNATLRALLEVQLNHKSNAVIKRAQKLLDTITSAA